MSVDPKKFGITSSLVETVKEALKGSQHKIDVAPPHGKITGADFKKLRGETSDPVAQKNIDKVNAVAGDLKKMASEPIKPMGSKTSSTTSLPKATFSLKPPMGEAAKPDFLDLDKDGNKKEPMKHAAKHAKEEVEQVDEVGRVLPDLTQKKSELKPSKSYADRMKNDSDKRKSASAERKAAATFAYKRWGKKADERLAKEEVEMTEAESQAAKQIAARKEAMKTHIQKKIANKQMSAMQAKANQRLKSINASNDKCSCGSTNESKMKCEVHGGKDKDVKMGREKIEVNPPLREAKDLPKKVVTKGHEIAKSLIKNKASVREPYAVGMAQAKKSAGIKN
jgi:hypothetical protein